MIHALMSLGKTAGTLHAVVRLLDTLKIYGVLVIGPKRVIRRVWRQEAHSGQWPYLEGLTFSPILGTPEKRLCALQTPAHIYLINYELITWLIPWIEHLWIRKGQYPPFDMIVFDEVRRLHDIDTQTHKALRRILKFMRRRVGLTGTPATAGLLDLYGQYLAVDLGQSFPMPYSQFKTTYFEPLGWNQYKFKPKMGAEKAIHDCIAPNTFSLHSDEYLELPAVVDNDITVELPRKVMKIYEEAERNEFIQMPSGEKVLIEFAASWDNKARQIANGFSYLDAPEGATNKPWEKLHDEKLDALESILQELEGETLLIVYQFVPDRLRIMKKLSKEHGIEFVGPGVPEEEEDEILDRWNEGKVPAMLTHSASLGHGLNLQFGGHQICWFGLPWSLDHYLQMIHRLRRPHQRADHVINHRIMAANTKESEVLSKNLKIQGATQDRLWEAMRSYMHKRYGGKIAA